MSIMNVTWSVRGHFIRSKTIEILNDSKISKTNTTRKEIIYLSQTRFHFNSKEKNTIFARCDSYIEGYRTVALFQDR